VTIWRFGAGLAGTAECIAGRRVEHEIAERVAQIRESVDLDAFMDRTAKEGIAVLTSECSQL
jgi:hypothetical protein